MISILIDPVVRHPSQNTQPKAPAGEIDGLDRQLLDVFANENAQRPVRIWSAINWVADSMGRANRTVSRRRRRDLLERLQTLRRLGLLRSAGRGHLLLASVEDRALLDCGSPVTNSSRRHSPHPNEASSEQLLTRAEEKPSSLCSGKSVLEGAMQRVKLLKDLQRGEALLPSAAGRVLQRRARQPRRRTGKVHGQWMFRDRPIKLGNGRLVYIYAALRGRVAWNAAPGGEREIGPGKCGVATVDEVALAKLPAAVCLGRLKRGVRERPSELKAAAARRNGLKRKGTKCARF